MVGLMLSGPIDLVLFFGSPLQVQKSQHYWPIVCCAAVFFFLGGFVGTLIERHFPHKISKIRPMVYCTTFGILFLEFFLNPMAWIVVIDAFLPLSKSPSSITAAIDYFSNIKHFLVVSLVTLICSFLVGIAIEHRREVVNTNQG